MKVLNKKKSIFIGSICLLVIVILIWIFLTRGNKEEKREEELISMAIVENFEYVETDETRNLEATVLLPDYSEYFMAVKDEAAKKAKSEEDYGEKMYSLAIKRIKKGDEDQISKSVTVNLNKINASKEKWSDEELKKLAQETVFWEELNEFCENVLSERLPEVDAEVEEE